MNLLSPSEDSISQLSGLDISGISNNNNSISLSQDVASVKRLDLLTTIMKISSPLKTFTPTQIERVYRMAVEDTKYKFSDENKKFLFDYLSQVKTIKKLISVQEEKVCYLQSPICLVNTIGNQLVYSAWSVDPEDRENIQDHLESLHLGNDVLKVQILCFDLKQVRIITINPSNSNLMQQSLSLALNESFNGSSSVANEAKAKAIEKVYEKLGNYPLHSDKLIDDFGNITFKKLFSKLLSSPNENNSKKWISLFRKPISDNWSHPCLQALRSYYRKF